MFKVGLVERSRAYRSFRLKSKLRSSLSLFKVGLVEWEAELTRYLLFRSKFLSVRCGQKSNPWKFGAKCNQRRREPANLYQCQRSEQPVKQLWRHGQQQRSAIMKKQEETNLYKESEVRTDSIGNIYYDLYRSCIVVVGGETNETNDTLKLWKRDIGSALGVWRLQLLVQWCLGSDNATCT